MEARPPVRLKPDTAKGFRPPYRTTSDHIERSLRLAWTDGALLRYGLHPEWAARLRREAYLLNTHASTSLEGNPLGLEGSRHAIHEAETSGRTPVDPAEREVVLHYRWFRRLGDSAPDAWPELRIAEICATHEALLEGVLPPERVGVLRGPERPHDVYFGRNAGTDPRSVLAELESLQYWYHHDGRIHPAPIRIAIWVHEFLSIHPFEDGNGRVARALAHRLLYTDGFPSSLLVALDRPFNDERDAYYHALDAARDQNDLTPWVDHFLLALEAAYAASDAAFDALSDIKAGLHGAERAVVEHILETGTTDLVVSDVAAAVSYRPVTVSLALRRLTDERRLLVHNGGRGRASAFRPSERLYTALLAKRAARTPAG